jgi:hypothetical protein
MIAEVGGAVVRDPATDLLTVNREFTVSLVLARCQLLDNGRRRWKVRFDTSLAPDITVAVRLDESNQARWTTTCCRAWTSASHASIWPITTASSSRATALTAWTTSTAWHGASASGGPHESSKEHRPLESAMIPLDRIEVLNPRERNSRVFDRSSATSRASA